MSKSKLVRGTEAELLPQTKMDLMVKVGDQGHYQKMLLIIFCSVSLINGMVFLGSSFFFIDTSFKCEEMGLLTDDCQAAVCSLPSIQWKNYARVDSNDMKTLATQFGPYYCGDSIYLDLAQSATYLGGLIGYLFFSFIADNYGRRTTFLVTWSITTAGCIVLVASQNLAMVTVGLFFLGLGAGISFNMCFYFLGQVVESNLRQKYSVILQPWYATGACLITTMFLLVGQWRVIVFTLMAVPSAIILFFIIIYVEETPQFLIRKGVPSTLKALNRIGNINQGRKNILTEEDIINVINEQVEEKKYQKTINVLDLCRFPSLRIISIGMSYFFFSVSVLYYGPILAIDSIGFNIFISSYVIQFSELLVYVPLFFYVDFIPRQKASIILFSMAGLCAAIILFLGKPKDCDFCSEAIIELIIVAIFRASSSLQFIIMYIYLVELFPTTARALGGGITSAFGTFGSSITPLLLGELKRRDIDKNIVFAALSLMAVGVATFLPQTLGQTLPQQIEQIAEQKKQLKRTGYVVIKDIDEYKSQYYSKNIKSGYEMESQKDI